VPLVVRSESLVQNALLSSCYDPLRSDESDLYGGARLNDGDFPRLVADHLEGLRFRVSYVQATLACEQHRRPSCHHWSSSRSYRHDWVIAVNEQLIVTADTMPDWDSYYSTDSEHEDHYAGQSDHCHAYRRDLNLSYLAYSSKRDYYF